jgi:hypothetical protein
MTTLSAVPEPANHSRRWLILIGCGALLIFACFVVGGVGAFLYLRDRLPSAAEPAVAYILDTSPRMSDSAEQGTRLSVAQAILAEVVRPADPELTSGLRVFGSGALSQSCADTELVVPFAPANQATIAEELIGLTVGGSPESALAQAMIAAIRDLNVAEGPHFIVVVTGGVDSCNPQAGELVASEADRSGIKLQTFVVGFQVSEQEAEALKTMAQQTAGGTYHNAPDAATLRSVLGSIQDRIEQAALASAEGEGEPQAEQRLSGFDEDDSATGADQPSDASGGYDSQTACDHPYFPLRQGARWAYSSDGNIMNWTVGFVSGDRSSATANVIMDFEGFSLNYDWTCSSEGVFYYQAATFGFDELGGTFNMELTSQSGAPLLPAEAFESGATWTSAYTLTTEVSAEDLSMITTTEVQQSHTAGEQQKMTTSLGSFEVIPVSTTGTTSSTSEFGSFTSSWASTCWFAYGVGWLRCETVSEGVSSVIELVSYSIP